MTCIRCLVEGRVQGVFFRASTKEVADKLAIRGYAKNLPDGRVEVLACGDAPVLGEFKSYLAVGPVHASVTSVNCETITPEITPDAFTIG